MSRPKFTVKSYQDEHIGLYALKKHGKTIAQIENRGNQILIYPLCHNMLFIHKGKLKKLQGGGEIAGTHN